MKALLSEFIKFKNLEDETETTFRSQGNFNFHGLFGLHNGNNNHHLEEPMDINENTTTTNGGGTNGCSTSGFISGTPPTSTTIVEDFDDFEGLFFKCMNKK